MSPSREESEFDWLGTITSRFNLNGDQVEILNSPDQFYSWLRNSLKVCKKRITIASLYLGSSQLDKDLVSSIYEACEAAEANGRRLDVQILLDHNRGNRGNPNSTTLLEPVVKRFGQVNVGLYHSPKLRGFLKWLLPDRWNEVLGVQHMKIYLCDDDLIISGANLSDSYFTNRQDRYILVKNCPRLGDFCSDVVTGVRQCSFQMNSDGGQTLHADCFVHPFEGNYHLFSKMLNDRVLKIHNAWKDRSSAKTPGDDTFIYPLIQMGIAGITYDDRAIQRALSQCSTDSQLHVASGYFNLTSVYSDLLLFNSAKLNILLASPQANGFFGGSGVSGFIPGVYVHVAKHFYTAVELMAKSNRIQMFEWNRDRWTFHAKGLWFTSPGQKLPSTTFVGSTNYGHRSSVKDLELQLVISTQNEKLKVKLSQEVENLFSQSVRVTRGTFVRPDHHVPVWVRLVAKFFRNFF